MSSFPRASALTAVEGPKGRPRRSFRWLSALQSLRILSEILLSPCTKQYFNTSRLFLRSADTLRDPRHDAGAAETGYLIELCAPQPIFGVPVVPSCPCRSHKFARPTCAWSHLWADCTHGSGRICFPVLMGQRAPMV